MSGYALLVLFLGGAAAMALAGPATPQADTFPTKSGDLQITFVGHGTLMLTWNGVVVHVDPVSSMGDYSRLPRADVILVTHEHGDHLDAAAIRTLTKDDTALVYTAACAAKLPGGEVMANGDSRRVRGISVTAVPAYNVVHQRSPGVPFHPRGSGNGYVLEFAGTRVYVAGDTENVPEMGNLKGIDVAFLPMNLPYTMTPEMVADAARVLRPKVLYPYHYGATDPQRLVELLRGEAGIEVRVRELR